MFINEHKINLITLKLYSTLSELITLTRKPL